MPGAAGGVGLELSKRCVQLGATVVGVDIDQRALERAQMKIALLGAKGLFHTERCDVRFALRAFVFNSHNLSYNPTII